MASPKTVLYLVVVFVLVFLTACGKKANLAEPLAEPAPPQRVSTTSWSMTRGGPHLSGHIAEPIPGPMEIVWTYTEGKMITAEAVVTERHVFVGTEYGEFLCFDRTTGEVLWKFTSDDAITAAAAVSGELVFLPSNDGNLYALNIETGEEAWRFGAEDKISAAPIVTPNPNGEGDWVLVNGYDGTTRCLNAKDGSRIWSYETEDFINGSPAVVDGKWVVFGGCDAQLHVVNLVDGSLEHKIPNDSQIVNSIATYKHMAYSGNYANQVVAFDVELGMIAWVYEDKNLPFFSSPGVSDKLLFIGSRDKHLHAIVQETGESAWKFPTGARVEGSPIVFNDGLIAGSSDGRVYALNLDSGEEIWRLDLGEGLIASPSYGYGTLIISGEDGTVFALKESVDTAVQ
ncbi:MAG: PQQ-binding-like beta-propeller repeat protein [Verrucomicrobia bacterium]|nr:PQQ-binding-like beta-propeller repeat protein [Verrucomicrobiota bacterium]MDA1067954.1 PQQ-binding-like beta-propeller repeat protein [Verrucomicrobiota bacterium]